LRDLPFARLRRSWLRLTARYWRQRRTAEMAAVLGTAVDLVVAAAAVVAELADTVDEADKAAATAVAAEAADAVSGTVAAAAPVPAALGVLP